MADFANLVLGVDTSGLKRGERALNDTTRAGGRTERAVKGTGRGFDKAGRSASTATPKVAAFGAATDRTRGVAVAATRAIALMGGAFLAVRQISQASQAFANMSNNMRVLGFEAEEVAVQINAIGDIANRTRSPLAATAQLYQRISIAANDLGASQQQVLRFTENVGLALAQQGGSAAQASGALLQLSQAMSGGTVRAEEFNSILEGAFPIAQAAANAIEGAAGSVGQLRNMVIAGEVSSREFFDAILSSSEALEIAFGKTVPTVSQAITVLSTKFTLFIGQADNLLGVSGALAGIIISLANNLDLLASVAVVGATAFGVRYVGAMIAARVATFSLTGALAGLKAALISTGIGALIVGAGLLLGFFSRLVTASGGFGNALGLLSDVALGVWDKIKAGGEVLLLGLQITFNNINNSFVETLGEMAQGWAKFSDGIAETNLGEMMGLEGGNVRATEIKYAAILNDIADAQFELNGALIKTKERLTGTTAGMDELRAAMAAANEDIDAGVDGSAALATELEGVVSAIDGSGGASGAVTQLADDLDDAADATDQFTQTFKDGMTDAIDYTVVGWRDGFSGLLDIIKSTLLQAAQFAIANPIKLALGLGGTGAAGMASQAMGGSGVIGSALGGLSALSGGIGSGVAVAMNGIMAGGGLGPAMGAISGGLGMGGAAGIGTAIGAVALPLLAVAAAFSFFRKKTTELDAGMRISVDGMESLVEGFKKIETSRFFGLSKKVADEFEAMDAAIADPLQNAVNGVLQNVFSMATGLGVAANTFDNFTTSLIVSLKGLDDAQAQVAIQDALRDIGVEFAEMATDLFEFQRHGENAAMILQRLSTSVAAANVVMEVLGLRMFDLTLGGANAASVFNDAFGSLENLNAISTNYYQKAFSDVERVGAATTAMSGAMSDLGVIMPTTVAGFRNLIEQADRMGNMDQVANLLLLFGDFAAIVDGQTAIDAASAAQSAAKAAAMAKNVLADAETLSEFLNDKLVIANENLTDATRNLDQAASDLEGALGREIKSLNDALSTATDNLEAAFDVARVAAMGTTEQDAEDATEALTIASNNLKEAFERLDAATLSSAQARQSDASDAFASATDGLKASFAAEQEATRAAFQVTIDGLANDLTGARERLATSRSIADALSGALNDRLFPSIDAQRQSLDEAAGYLQSLVGMGRITDMDALQNALRAVSNPSTDSFSTQADFRRSFDMTSAAISALDTSAGATVSADEQAVTLLETQIDKAQAQSDLSVGLLQQQLDGILGVDNSVLSLSEAITQFTSAQVELVNANAVVTELTKVEATLQTVADATEAFRLASVTSADADAALVAANAAVTTLDAQREALLGVEASALSVEAATIAFQSAQDAASETSIALLQGQIDAITGVDSSIMTLTQAMTAFASAAAAEAAARSVQTAASISASNAAVAAATLSLGPIEKIYKDVLGRTADAVGLAFYRDNLTAGRTTIDQIRANIAASTEAETFNATGVARLPTFDGGGYTGNGSRTGGMDGQGGFLAMMHPQETITDNTRGGGGNAELVSEMRALNNRIEQLTAYQRQTTINTGNTSFDLKDIRRNGVQVEPVAGAIFNTDEVA
jgi:tape measure domain-containing protein